MATTVLGLKTFTASDPVDYNEINDNYNKIDNGVKTALQGRAAHNLLDNSDFRNPVNQRGATTATAGSGYFIDRWRCEGNCAATISANGLSATGDNGICQILLNKHIGKTLTLAACEPDGTLLVLTTVVTEQTGSAKWLGTYYATNGKFIGIMQTSGGHVAAYLDSQSGYFIWAALYEGSYTADTLPAYVPKGYASELAECQRYYKKITIGNGFMNIAGFSQTEARGLLITSGMRVNPTVNSSLTLRLYDGSSYKSVTSIGVSKMTETSMMLSMLSSGLKAQTLYTIHPSGGYADIELSADL